VEWREGSLESGRLCGSSNGTDRRTARERQQTGDPLLLRPVQVQVQVQVGGVSIRDAPLKDVPFPFFNHDARCVAIVNIGQDNKGSTWLAMAAVKYE
jgi:hypothetical protein